MGRRRLEEVSGGRPVSALRRRCCKQSQRVLSISPAFWGASRGAQGAKHGDATPDRPRPLEDDPSTLQEGWCPAMSCNAVLCSVPLCDAMLCVAMLCDAMLHYAMQRHAMTCYALPCSSTPCHAVLYYASRTLSGSLPCSTSDCTNKEEIYVMVRDGREG